MSSDPMPEDWIGGMTLRDYFAAHASESDINEHTEYQTPDQVDTEASTGRTREEARYAFADAMLEARKPKEPKS